jgi:hypothetical protein
MESPFNITKLSDIPIGGRLLVRSRKDWRTAVVARRVEDQITLSVSSASGRNYRLRRSVDCEIETDGLIPFLIVESAENWRENFSRYDVRW